MVASSCSRACLRLSEVGARRTDSSGDSHQLSIAADYTRRTRTVGVLQRRHPFVLNQAQARVSVEELDSSAPRTPCASSSATGG